MFLLFSSKLGFWIMREVPLGEAFYLSDSWWPSQTLRPAELWGWVSLSPSRNRDFFPPLSTKGVLVHPFSVSESTPLSQPWSVSVVLPSPWHGAAAITAIMSSCFSWCSPRATGICCSALLQCLALLCLQILKHTYWASHFVKYLFLLLK